MRNLPGFDTVCRCGVTLRLDGLPTPLWPDFRRLGQLERLQYGNLKQNFDDLFACHAGFHRLAHVEIQQYRCGVYCGQHRCDEYFAGVQVDSVAANDTRKGLAKDECARIRRKCIQIGAYLWGGTFLQLVQQGHRPRQGIGIPA